MLIKRLLKSNFGHRCSLPKENILDEILPGNDWKTKLKRIYHITFMVCENNPRTKHFCASHKRLVLEKIGHVKKYPFTIHPTCPFRMFWDFLMIIIDIITLIYFPYNGAFCIDFPAHIRYECDSKAILSMNTICIIDIMLNFVTICYKEKKVIVDYKSIAINYLKSSFIFDIISSVPVIILTFLHVQQVNLWVIILQFFRIFNLIHYVKNTAKIFFVGPNTMQFVIIFLSFFLLVHWAACISIIITVMENHLVKLGVPDKKSWMTFGGLWNRSAKLIYINSLFRSVCYFAGSSQGETFSKNHALQPIQWLFSKIFFAIFVGALMQALTSTFNHKFKYKKCIYRVNQFSNHKLISKKLNKQLVSYITFKFNGRAIINESKIFENISTRMKQDIIVSDRLRYLNNVVFLSNLPNNLIRALCLMFNEHLFLPGDILISSDCVIKYFYLIVSGTAACYAKNGFELYHLTEGDYCGEIELLFPDSNSKCTVVALENCKIFSLNRGDFFIAISALSEFPEIMEYIKIKILRHTQMLASMEKQLLQLHKEVYIDIELD